DSAGDSFGHDAHVCTPSRSITKQFLGGNVTAGAKRPPAERKFAKRTFNSAGAAASTGHSGAVTSTPAITIPSGLLPRDGRFGSGPSKVRQEAIVDLLGAAPTYLGTSHRQPTVQFTVAALRNGL